MAAEKSERTETEDVVWLVEKARAGDSAAFDRLVYRYQKSAVTYAASLLGGDADRAQDAALAAFVRVYQDLPTLRTPDAFAAWLRKIVWKQCDRIRRSERIPLVSWEQSEEAMASPLDECPEQILLRRETRDSIARAIQSLPPSERAVTLLFYGGQYSHNEIADFLKIAPSTVKSRLFSARKHLKERLFAMAQNYVQEARRPLADEAFLVRVRQEIVRANAEITGGDTNEASVREHHPQARYRDTHPIFHLTNALISAALSTGVRHIHLTPQAGGLAVRLVAGSTTKTLVTVPEALREAVVARLKDGAGMNPEDTATEQAGVTPVFDSLSKSLYDMYVRTSPTTGGEKMELELIRASTTP